MNKVLFLFLIPIISVYGQIQVVEESEKNSYEENLIGQVNQFDFGGVFIGIASLSKLKVIDGKQYYYMSWQNQEYSTIDDRVSVTFYASEQELDGLFDIFKSVFKNNSDKEVNVGDENFYLKRFSKKTLYIRTKDGWFTVNPAALHALFGKGWDKKEWKNYLNS